MQYINRINALDADKVYILSGEGISTTESVIKYNEINEIYFKYVPSKYYGNIYECTVVSDSSSLKLSNRRYIKLATFDYQSAHYNEFVKALDQKLDAKVNRRSGMSPVRFWLELPLATAFFGLMIAVLFLFGGWLVAGVFVLVILMRLLPYYVKNFPRSFQTSQIPKSVLPTK